MQNKLSDVGIAKHLSMYTGFSLLEVKYEYIMHSLMEIKQSQSANNIQTVLKDKSSRCVTDSTIYRKMGYSNRKHHAISLTRPQ